MPPGEITRSEILQQPEVWPETVRLVRESGITPVSAPIVTGAGTSFYAAMAIEAAWSGSRAVPSTDLFLSFWRYFPAHATVVSVARSGDSPESVAVVDRIHRKLPAVQQMAITCNPAGALAKWPDVEPIVLGPRTNDRGLAMTCSFSNLVLAGMTLARPEEVEAALPSICGGWDRLFPSHAAKAKSLAAGMPKRLVALGSPALFGAAREASLKVLELTGGRVVALPETYLGLRHGPLSFLERDTPVLCFLSSDAGLRRYELDLVRELRAKQLGRTVALGDPGADGDLFDEAVTTGASSLPDHLRTPAEIVFAQLLAFELSLAAGLDPDNPSPGGVIHRVVQGVRIYE